MPSINLKHRAAVHHATAASFSLHRMHMESYADAISALLECFEDVSEDRQQLRQKVTLLRDAMESAWQDGYAFCGAEGLSDAQKQFQTAFAATDPKIQQSHSFTDPVTDDDFLHMID